MIRAAAFALALAACFNPTYDNPACPTGECPPGLACGTDGVCRFDGTATDAPDVDAPNSDGPDIDAPEIDAIDAPAIDAPIDSPMDAPIDAPVDAPPIDVPPGTIDIAYLPPSDEDIGTGNVVISNPLTIDTSVGATLPNFGAGTRFSVANSTGGGADIVVLHVGSLAVNNTLRIVGTRPFAVVAGGSVTIAGTIDASAVGTATPGPNGALTDSGPGAGIMGARAAGPMVTGTTVADPGGGGASYGSFGGDGGDATCDTGCIGSVVLVGGARGATYNTGRTQLRGGSGGGSAPDAAASCLGFDGGAGGGAILIYSAVSITIGAAGVIEANGGGGGRGDDCTSGSSSGAGGGSGGQIELQAPTFSLLGAIAANGGGGGSGSDGGDGLDGMNGSDGLNSAMAAAGGVAAGDDGGAGGNGAAGAAAAVGGQDMGVDQNGGGGGGGAGLITIRHQGAPPTIQGIVSPSPQLMTY